MMLLIAIILSIVTFGISCFLIGKSIGELKNSK